MGNLVDEVCDSCHHWMGSHTQLKEWELGLLARERELLSVADHPPQRTYLSCSECECSRPV